MTRSRDFRSARITREPLFAKIEPDDEYPEDLRTTAEIAAGDKPYGRLYEFPGDVGADEMVAYIENHGSTPGEGANADAMPLDATMPFLLLVIGTGRLADYRKTLSFTELAEIAGWLWTEYVEKFAFSEDGEDDPKEPAQPPPM